MPTRIRTRIKSVVLAAIVASSAVADNRVGISSCLSELTICAQLDRVIFGIGARHAKQSQLAAFFYVVTHGGITGRHSIGYVQALMVCNVDDVETTSQRCSLRKLIVVVDDSRGAAAELLQ